MTFHPRPVPVVPVSAHHHTHLQALYQPAATWAPIDALQLHASMWTGDVVPALDCHLLPLAGTRRRLPASPGAGKDSAPVTVLSPLASTSATLAAAAASQFSRENVRSEHIDDVHFHSPWAIGGVNRLQCYIHALTSSVLTAQATMRQLFKEIDSHSQSADTLIAETDQRILHAHRVESGDATMVCCFARSHLSADSRANTRCRRLYTPLISSRYVASDQTMRMPFSPKKAGWLQHSSNRSLSAEATS